MEVVKTWIVKDNATFLNILINTIDGKYYLHSPPGSHLSLYEVSTDRAMELIEASKPKDIYREMGNAF